MKKITVLFLFVFLSSFIIIGQAPKWEIIIGGTHNDRPYRMVQTQDGGYAATGETTSFGDTIYGNVYLVKVDSTGNLQWARSVGGNTQTDIGYDLVQTKDKGYAVAGYTLCYGAGNEDVYILKFDSSGNLQWTRTVGGTKGDYGCALAQTSDGGYLISGSTLTFTTGYNNPYVIKLDSAGALLWAKSYEGPGNDLATDMVQTKDRGYAIIGYGDSNFIIPYRVNVTKIDSAGNLLWTQSIGGAGNNLGDAIAATLDGGVVITGWTDTYGAGREDMYVVKLDSSGNLQWTRTIGGGLNEYGNGIVQTADKSYLITGGSNSFYDSLYSNVYTVKLDSNGNLLWTKFYPASTYSYGSSLVQTKSGYTLFGAKGDTRGFSHFLFLTMDTAGNTCEPAITGGVLDSGGTATGWGTLLYGNGGTANSGGILTSGSTQTTICTNITTSISAPAHILNGLVIYPNPCSITLNIDFENQPNLSSIQITDITGRVLFTEHCSLSTAHFSVDVSGLVPGMYFLRLNSNSGTEVKKFIKK